MNPFANHDAEREKLHRAMYRLHHSVCRNALPQLREALMVIHARETEAYEGREKLRDYATKLNAIRDLLESAWQDAARVRTDIIRDTGCDCACERPSDQP